jgi:hypothetical protein
MTTSGYLTGGEPVYVSGCLERADADPDSGRGRDLVVKTLSP